MLGSCLLFLQNVSECITAMEELEFDVVCMLWHTDDLILDLDARLVTGAWQLERLLVRWPFSSVTCCQSCMQAPHSSNSMRATITVILKKMIIRRLNR